MRKTTRYCAFVMTILFISSSLPASASVTDIEPVANQISSTDTQHEESDFAIKKDRHGNVEIRDGENLVDVQEIASAALPDFFKVETEDGTALLNGSLLESKNPEDRAAALVSPTKVDLLWPDMRAARTYIYRDEVLLATLNGETSFVDTSINPGSKYEYTVTAETPLSRDEMNEFVTSDEAERIDAGEMEVPSAGTTWGIPATVPKDSTDVAVVAAAQVAAKAAAARTSTEFRYKTFIAGATAPAPQGACTPPIGSYRFKGDNRSWSTGGSNRTYARVTMNWSNKTMTFGKSVGSTTRQKKVSGVWKNESTKKASAAGITFKNQGMSSTSGTAYINVVVTNPLCNTAATLPIFGRMTVNITKSGSFSLRNAIRRPVPHHETYIKANNQSSWKTIFGRTNKGFGCLTRVNVCNYESLNFDNGRY